MDGVCVNIKRLGDEGEEECSRNQEGRQEGSDAVMNENWQYFRENGETVNRR